MELSLSDDSENSEFETNSFQVRNKSKLFKNKKYELKHSDRTSKERSVNGYELCRACKKEIFDKYYLRVNENSWHEECLKCDTCNLTLVSEETCFIKKNKIFCKIDYYK
jgi:hypothetical protein